MAEGGRQMADGKRQKAGGVPEGWREVKLDDCSDGKRPAVKAGPFGSALKKEFYKEAGYKIYGQEQVISGDPSFGNYYIDDEKYKELESCSIKSGDILVSLVGTVGKALLIPENHEEGVINPRLLRISVDDRILLPEYLYNIFKSPETVKYLNSLAQGGTMGVLNATMISSLNILLPPLPEQQKIAAILSTWDDSIATLTNLLTAKRQQKRGLAEALLTGKKRLPGFEGEWEKVRLGDVFKVQKGAQKNRMSLSDVGTYPVINGGITPSGFAEEFNAEGNTVTISEGGNSCGFVSLQKERFWCGGHCYTIQSDVIPVDFQYQILKGQESQIMGLRVGSGLPNIQKKALEAFELNLPTDSAEQKAIASILSTLDSEIASLEALKAKVQEQKRGLMDELLTGRVRVKVEG